MAFRLFAAAHDPSAMSPQLLWVLPFALLLLAIALGPLVHRHWWERTYHLVSVGLGAICAAYYLFFAHSTERLWHTAVDYLSFMAFVGSLFVISGGIHLRPRGQATPAANCLILLLGALLANVLSSVGACALLVRPFIQVNKVRFTSFHLVFFIFIVGNVGGCLTSIGNPPLFLGYLKGVPFWWVTQHCWQPWAVGVSVLLAIFYVFDKINFRRMAPEVQRGVMVEGESWRFEGLHNSVFLGIALAAVFLQKPVGLREVLMVGAAAGSYFTTGRRVHEANDFDLAPIKEIGWLFLGLFTTMMPALDYLAAHASELGINSPLRFYWLAGSLSAVLDNAPTYLAFLATAMGNEHLSLERPEDLARFIAGHERSLLAISVGAVCFGAMTYLGNAPNLMVRAIAERAGRRTPSFFGYIFHFALPALLPVLALLAWLFFRD